MKFGKPLIVALLAATTTSLRAQDAPAPAPASPVESDEDELEDEDDGEEIVVVGQRLRGAVAGDIPPEITLDRRDIRALGASNLAEMIDALAPQTRSGRGRGDGGGPVVLLNGRRIPGFSEIRDLPPEAVDRVDILPEEVALKYGYRADQRVVNIVLRRRFRATTLELDAGAPTAGGRLSGEVEAGILRIDRAGRWSLDAEYNRSTALLESERDILGAPGTAFDLGAFRTLVPQSAALLLNGSLNRTLFKDISATLNARLEARTSRSLFGVPSAALLLSVGSDLPAPLARDGNSQNFHLGLGLNGELSPWRWSLTANLDRNRSASRTDTDRISTPRDRDRSQSIDTSGEAQLVSNGPLLAIPPGTITTTLKAGASMRDFSSDTVRSGIAQGIDLSRDRADIQANVDIPIASRRNDFLSAIGDLSANFNYAVDRLSDVGTLTTLGYGLNWSPIEKLRIIASVTDEEGAPTVQQLGDPLIATPNARVFDFTRGETVDVVRLDGGNSALLADDRRVMKLGLTVQPRKEGETDLTLSADYTDTRIRDVIAGFPSATPAIEAAFPDRFTRDADGRLTAIDNRPVNFARSDREELRYGFNLSRPLGKPDPAREAFRQQRREGGGGQPGARRGGGRPQGAGPRGPGGGGRGGGGFGRGGGFGGGGRGNLQLGLYHTVRLTDSILIRDGVPELDLLGGSAVGNRGGRPRHEIELQAAAFKNGFGGFLRGNWQSGTTVRGADIGGADDLRFGSFSTLNLRLFADLGAQDKLVRDRPFFRGFRVSIGIDNLLDSRLRVSDASGAIPLSFQPNLVDPLGRSVRISLRKLFLPGRRRRAGR